MRGITKFQFEQPISEVVDRVIDLHKTAEKRVAKILDQNHNNYTFENTYDPVNEIENELNQGISELLIRRWFSYDNEVSEETERFFQYHSTQSLKVYKRLFKAFEKISETKLTREQRSIIDHTIEYYKHNGVGTSQAKAAHRLNAKIDRITRVFGENQNTYTANCAIHITDPSDLEGLSNSLIEELREEAKAQNLDGWVLPVDDSLFVLIARTAKSRSLRKTMFERYYGAHSENLPLVSEILKMRHSLAKMMKYPSYAHYALDGCEESDPEKVYRRFVRLFNSSYKKMQDDIEMLSEHAKEVDGIEKLEPWDYYYYAASLEKELLAEHEVYLDAATVCDAVLKYFGNLFGLEVISKKAPVWDEDVRYYIVKKNGKVDGAFYVDLYGRNNKSGGAWVQQLAYRTKKTLPVLVLATNSTKVLAQDDLVALLHEAGHLFHGLLNQSPYTVLGGIESLPGDLVEMPSQFLEKFIHDRQALNEILRHPVTGDAPPKDLINVMVQKPVTRRIQMTRFLSKVILDLHLHLNFKDKDSFISDTLKAVVPEESKLLDLPSVASLGTFSEDQAGYAAGYYQYPWSEAIAFDAFDIVTASKNRKRKFQAFAECFLYPGGKSLKTMFRKFANRRNNTKAWRKFYLD